MEAYIDTTPLWELPHASQFPQLADDDFLALLHKQFPNVAQSDTTGLVDAVNPQNISRYSLQSMTPPSEDSSPSPPNFNNEQAGNDDSGDPALKRKASDGDFDDDGPSSKSQHFNNKKSNLRRKSSGTPGPVPKDESRLLKRKEQNRAAQRAFRERKEKHVKDLEDKVAALEAKNEQAQSENENLRDLLTRLQQENVSLKQSPFTFQVPKNGGNSPETPQPSTSYSSPARYEPPTSSQSPISPASPASSAPPVIKMSNPLDWSSLTTFDPNMLSLLDDSPQPTATDGAMQMDFGFGPGTNAPFTTIASNPMFMSFASSFDTAQPPPPSNDHSSFNFDMSSFSPWPSPPSSNQDAPSLDDLLAGYMPRGNSDFSYMQSTSSSASDSPIAHHAHISQTKINTSQSPAISSSSSPSSIASDPLFDTSRESASSDSDIGHEDHMHTECPKTKGELVKRIVSSGPSPFAPTTLHKGSDALIGSIIKCKGTGLPKTPKSDKNIEVLSAWRSITSNPRFKDVDINNLCSEFTNKARCDGTKVVLEPQGVKNIIQYLTTPKQ